MPHTVRLYCRDVLGQKRAIVVGGSSGIGAEICRQLAKQGWKVAAVARREDRLQTLKAESLLTYAHDVRHTHEVPALFLKITADLGGLDLIVYAAGVMPSVGPSEFDTAKDQDMIETNLLGAVAWLNEAAIRFENARHGTIVGIGSVAGDRGRYGQPVYNASKAALATYLEALRNRLARHGVKVTTVKPGPVQTEMTEKLNLKGAMPVEEAARRIILLASSGGERYLSLKHRLIFYILKRVPSPIFRRLKV